MMATVPDEWVGQEVRLRWDSGGEAMIWINSEPQQVYSVTTARFSCFSLPIHHAGAHWFT